MYTIYKLAKTELQTLFYSPIAWLILVIFAFQTAATFAGVYFNLADMQYAGYPRTDLTSSLFASSWEGVFPEVQAYLYLYIPLLTMGLMSRELGSGSITLLYSSPVTNFQIIFGKFLAMMVYGLALMGVLLLFGLFGWITIKDFDISAVLVGILGLYLLMCAYSAVGLFMSSLTSYQVVAAILTLSMLAVLNYIRNVGQSFEFVRDITYWLGMSGRANEFTQGLLTSEDVLYFIIVAAMFIAFSVIRLHAVRQKTPFAKTYGKYLAVIVISCLLGYVSSRPKLMTYYDATTVKSNTLTPNSQDVIAKMKGGLTITTFVNLFDANDLHTGLPENIKNDQLNFKQYVRFKPEIKQKYVYYYDTIPNSNMEKYFPGKNVHEIAQELFNNYKLDSAMFLRPEEIRQRVDLSQEGNVFVRLLERESGEKTYLRVYNDMMHFPSEAEITAAFKRLVMELPKVGFLTGHGERNNRNVGDRDYNSFAFDKKFRHSLINQGFDVADVNLNQEVPEDIRIMVIAEMRSPMTEAEKVNFDKYVERGGNILITTEPGRQEAMAPLLAEFGVKQLDGRLVRPTEDYAPDLILVRPTPAALDLSYVFERLIDREQTMITMPGVSALEYEEVKGFTVRPIFRTDSMTWNEVESTNFVDDEIVLNSEAGEEQKSYFTGLALSRKVKNKEQKIMILGDADCISNGELYMVRRGIESSNYTIINGGFFWMSDGEVPIDVRRPYGPDDKIHLSQTATSVWTNFWKWAFPIILLITSVIILVRRKGR